MAKRSFVMLAHKYDPRKNHVGSYYMSDKLDGIRCFYDGGLTRGLPASEVPWANTEKDSRLKEIAVSTGLWTRYGHPIYAPYWFLEMLPDFPLDGELHCPSGSWQTLSSTVKKFVPIDSDWKKIQYSVFDSPSIENMFADGIINETNFKKRFYNIDTWVKERRKIVGFNPFIGQLFFLFVYEKLKYRIKNNDIIRVHEQIELPYTNYQGIIENRLNQVVEKGGEGLMLRAPMSIWMPERSHYLLKYKPFQDDEGIVVGYAWGRKTELGSKLLGKMGALILDYNGKRLELSGFTDEERVLINSFRTVDIYKEGDRHAGEEVDHEYMNPRFPRGSIVTFRYRELSDNLIPKEARFLRKP